MIKRLIGGIFCAVLLLLAGCALLRQNASTQLHALSWSVRRAQLSRLHSWQVKGSFAVRYDGKAAMGYFNWQRHGQYNDLRISGPVGLRSMRITGYPGRVILQGASTRKSVAQTPEALLVSTLGWHLPVTQLQDWMLGLPAPHAPLQSTFDALGHLIELKQLGWLVHFSDFVAIDGIDLPTRISLRREQLHIKLHISRWRI